MTKRRKYNPVFGKLIALCLAVCACRNGHVTVQTADWSDVDTVVYDRDNGWIADREAVFDSVSFIKLEATDNSLIGKPDLVLFGDSTIVVADMTISKAIFLFDFDGNYLGRMSGLGNGHNEYLYLSYVAKDSKGDFAVMDETRDRIMFFDERGHFIEEIESGVFATAFAFINENLMAFDISGRYPYQSSTYYNLTSAVKDRKMNDVYMFGQTGLPEGFNVSRIQNLYAFGDNVYCNVNFEDVIYQLGPDGVQARYRLILTPDNASDYYPFKDTEELDEIWRNHDFFNGVFVELADYSYFNIAVHNYSTEMPDLLYRHSDGLSVSLNRGFNDPMMAFLQRPRFRYGDNCLVNCIAASEVLAVKFQFGDRIGSNAGLKELYDGLESDSNPILFFYHVAF